jgi:thiamine-phosphate pyrophosphorylase
MNKKKIAFRILDANFNRLSEALRVSEDIIRFTYKHQAVVKNIKNLRHKSFENFSKLTQILNKTPAIYRRSLSDTGSKIYQKSEVYKKNLKEILESNLHRSREALRVLEEISKLYSSAISSEFKKIRFSLYVLQEKIHFLVYSEKKIELFCHPNIYYICDIDLLKKLKKDPLSSTKKIIEAGIKIIQIRGKNRSAKEIMDFTKKIIPPARKKKALVIMNDRADIAITCGCDGIHIGQVDISVNKARQICGNEFIIGASTHNIKEAKKAQAEGANYIACGPIFHTKTKKDAGKPQGLKILKQIKKISSVPLVAIGGINYSNIDSVFSAGADVAAVGSGLIANKNVTQVTKNLLKQCSKYNK